MQEVGGSIPPGSTKFPVKCRFAWHNRLDLQK